MIPRCTVKWDSITPHALHVHRSKLSHSAYTDFNCAELEFPPTALKALHYDPILLIRKNFLIFGAIAPIVHKVHDSSRLIEQCPLINYLCLFFYNKTRAETWFILLMPVIIAYGLNFNACYISKIIILDTYYRSLKQNRSNICSRKGII